MRLGFWEGRVVRPDAWERRVVRLAALAAIVLGGCLVLGGLAPTGVLAEPSEEHSFEVEPGSFRVEPSTFQAGAHEDLTTTFDFAHNASGQTYGDVRNVAVNLPPGFMGSSTAVPTCTDAQLLAFAGNTPCPPASQVGTIELDLAIFGHGMLERYRVPVDNMEVTSFGVAAELGFSVLGFTQVLPIALRPGDAGLTITAPNIEQLAEPHAVKVVIWGLPAAESHDQQRGQRCFQVDTSFEACELGGKSAGIPVKPFLSNPTSCAPSTATIEAYSWENPDVPSSASYPVAAMEGCSRVPFDPSIEAGPTTTSAESPTGLNFSMIVPQRWSEPLDLETANLDGTTVTLPEGVTINPSAGSGLGACTPGQYAAETSSSLPGEGCPDEAKIGSIEIETPLISEKITGSVYIATPYNNPFDSLLGLYIVAKNPARGIIVKVAGKIEPNPVTGRLVTTFQGAPQAPFSRFTLRFRSGATAPLVSPPVCGSYAVQAALSPWSEPLEAQLVSSPPFAITQGVREGPCPTGGIPPFHPQVISGTQNNDAGSYSPFYLRILREDGEQEITRFTTVLPPGLSGNLSGIPFCPEADIEAARTVSGEQEIEDPSCPAASEIGHTIVSAGVGTVLAQTPGKVYLAGPYHGSALSIVSITSAKVGPFDLGTVVIRFALHINPSTAQVEVSANGSDPIPHIIDGIVVHVREVRVYMDREKFILNPTNCDPMSISETVTGAGADPSNPAAQAPVSATAPFQAADCSSLQFKPGFKVSTSGKTSKANGASLSVKLTVPGALGTQANIARVKVELPKALPSRLTTLRKACLAATFEADPAGCPAASIVGQATALTPIVPVPLTGPAYFVSHGGEAFPSLIIVLQGYGVTVDLVGSTFISEKGVTSSTFKTVPDVPVGTFELTLPEGQFSALAANVNVCKSRLVMPTEFVAQNGAVLDQTTKIQATGCPKSKPATHKRKRHTRAKSRKARRAARGARGGAQR
jgi:hypothetical protein